MKETPEQEEHIKTLQEKLNVFDNTVLADHNSDCKPARQDREKKQF